MGVFEIVIWIKVFFEWEGMFEVIREKVIFEVF